MIKVLDAANMLACDRAAIEEYSIPGALLTENAGVQVLEAIVAHFDGEVPLSTGVVCGRGNNGGDGLVVARHLYNLGHEAIVYLLGDPEQLEGDARLNQAIAAACGVPIVALGSEEAWQASAVRLERHDCIVDAVLGTGLRDAARGVAALAIEAMNGCGAPIVAVDLPSGLDADSGRVPGVAAEADLTVTFAAPKPCHVLPPATDHCGELVVADISIPQQVLEAAEAALWILTPEDAATALPRRARDSHKGSHGRVLVVAGSPGTAGAAVLAARGALRGGAGLVDVACPESVYAPIASQLTEALVHALPAAADGGFGAAAAPGLTALANGADVVALGPGLGTGEEARDLVATLALTLECPAVIDADGLNLLAAPEAVRGAAAARILTPHPGEAGRLLGRDAPSVQHDRPAAARELATRSGALVVLKGYRTLVAAPGQPPIVNPTGNAGLASGGTGDVLTGIIAALLAQRLEPETAAWLGVCLQGIAADLVAAEQGIDAMIATDVVEALPTAFEAVRETTWP